MRSFRFTFEQFEADVSAPCLASRTVSVSLLGADGDDVALCAIQKVQVGGIAILNAKGRIKLTIEDRLSQDVLTQSVLLLFSSDQ